MNYIEFYKQASPPTTPKENEMFERLGEDYPEAVAQGERERSKAQAAQDISEGENVESAKPKEPGWRDTVYNNYAIDRVEGYPNHLPILALLGLTGALGGYAFANKKKRGAGALFGGLSLPALYLAYIASRRNGILPMGGKINNYLDKGINKINNWGNKYNPFVQK